MQLYADIFLYLEIVCIQKNAHSPSTHTLSFLHISQYNVIIISYIEKQRTWSMWLNRPGPKWVNIFFDIGHNVDLNTKYLNKMKFEYKITTLNIEIVNPINILYIYRLIQRFKTRFLTYFCINLIKFGANKFRISQ